jgi:hypothetical protein
MMYDDNLYTDFGQIFSHTIAQYACDKSLQSILNLVSDALI